MPFRSFKDIRHTQQQIWPAVRKSIDLAAKSRQATANDPLASRAAQARARLPWERVVADETVWAIAKADLLASPEAAEVIKAARAWLQTWKEENMIPSTRDGDHSTDVALYQALQVYLATFQIPDEVGA